MPEYTIQDQLKEAQRELRMRQACFPRWVSQERLSPAIAQYRLQCQAAIVATLAALADVDETLTAEEAGNPCPDPA